METIQNASTEIAWDATSRIAHVSYTPGSTLSAADGDLLISSLTRWIGDAGIPFAILADANKLKATDGEYRARASTFFRTHRDTAFIALVNVGPVIHIVVEMFRLGTGIQLKTFKDDAAARAWLRSKGIAA